MKTTYANDGRLPQHTAVGNEDTDSPYPTSPHEWLSTKVLEEKDARIAELEAENKQLFDRANDVMAENTRLQNALAQCSEKRAEMGAVLDDIVLSAIDMGTYHAVGSQFVEAAERVALGGVKE